MTADVIAETLDRLTPEQPFVADWQDVLRRAGETRARGAWRPRKRLLIAAAIAVLALIPLAATAAGDEWGFFRSLYPPATTPEVLQTGSWAGHGWELVGYRAGNGGLCYTVISTESPRTRRAGAMGCGGSPEGHPRGSDGQGGMGWLMSEPPDRYRGRASLGPLPPYVAGAVIEGADEVSIHLSGGRVIRTPTFAVHESLGSVVFFAAPLPAVADVETIVGRAGDGRVIACSNVDGRRNVCGEIGDR